MSNQPEITSYDAGVYQIEATDPVDGGVGAVTNAPLLALSNRTNYLKKHLDDIESGNFVPNGLAPINSPGFSGTPTAPTQAAADSSTKLSNTAFVQAAVNGLVSVSVAGGGTTTLTAAQYGVSTIVLTGAITANKAVVFPALSGHWQVLNKTSGAFSITLKTAAGTGIVVTQGASTNIYGDGTNIGLQQTDFISPDLTGSPTATTPGEADTSARIATMAGVRSAMALFGLGTGVLPALPNDDCNTVVTSGSYRIGSSSLNTPPGFGLGSVLRVEPWNDATVIQMAYGSPGIAMRIGKPGAWPAAWDFFAKLNSPTFTGTPAAPKAPQFATGSQIINADALKASGLQFSKMTAPDISVSTLTLTVADVGSIVAFGGSGGGTVILPKASTVPAGGAIGIRAGNSSVSTNTLKVASGDSLAGSIAGAVTQLTLRFADSFVAVSDGSSNWIIVSDSSYNFVTQAITQCFSSNFTATASPGSFQIPGGPLIQWGTATLSGSTTSVVVTLGKAFTTNPLIGISSDVGATAYPSGINLTSKTQVTVSVAPYITNSGAIAAKNSTAAIAYIVIGW